MTPTLMKLSTKALLSVTSNFQGTTDVNRNGRTLHLINIFTTLENRDSRTVPLSRMKLLNQNVLWQQGQIEKREKKKIIYKMWKKYNKLFLH